MSLKIHRVLTTGILLIAVLLSSATYARALRLELTPKVRSKLFISVNRVLKPNYCLQYNKRAVYAGILLSKGGKEYFRTFSMPDSSGSKPTHTPVLMHQKRLDAICSRFQALKKLRMSPPATRGVDSRTPIIIGPDTIQFTSFTSSRFGSVDLKGRNFNPSTAIYMVGINGTITYPVVQVPSIQRSESLLQIEVPQSPSLLMSVVAIQEVRGIRRFSNIHQLLILEPDSTPSQIESPTPTVTTSPSPTPSPLPTFTPVSTPHSTFTPTPTSTTSSTPTPSLTPTPSPTHTPTPTPTITPTPTGTLVPTPTPTPTPTATITQTPTPTPSPTSTVAQGLLWSNPNTWPGNAVPVAGQNVTIPQIRRYY